MPQNKPLTNMDCKNAQAGEKPRKLADGGGLYLEIMPNGSKYWRMKYRFLGKEKRLAFGVYPEVSLKEARDMREQARKLKAEGIDPSEAKKAAKQQLKENYSNTFEIIALEWLEYKKSEASERYCKSILHRLEANLFKDIGHLPIRSISSKDVLIVLKKIEERGVYETTKRLRQYISQIFNYAIAHGKADNNPAVPLMKALKTKKVEHQKSLPENELPILIRKIDENDARLYPQTRLGLKLMLLTFTRKVELSRAKWSEISLEDKMWIIPSERMKMKKEHLVPLSGQAIEVLEELQLYRNQWDYVFPSPNAPRKPMHEDTLLRALYRLGYKGVATVHGFRSLATTIIMERLGYRFEVPDRQLAHSRGNNVRAAYDRAEFLEERIQMMQDWADYLDRVCGAHVIYPDFKKVV